MIGLIVILCIIVISAIVLFCIVSSEFSHDVSTRSFCALGKQEKNAEETVIQGWVARDKNGDLVCCAGSKPFKEEKMPFWKVDFRNFI